ncbi:MAG TPA: hypothetical protein PLO67_06125, partial [Saprospiraceae bacterium]|nr:hypothetical protein [Saprospiraceae bacterium]
IGFWDVLFRSNCGGGFFLVFGVWCMVFGARCFWCLVCRVWCLGRAAFGVWCVVYGVWGALLFAAHPIITHGFGVTLGHLFKKYAA